MKRLLFLVLSVVIIVALCSCNDNDDFSSNYPDLSESSSSEQQSERGQGKLVVEGKQVDATFTVYQTYAELPIISVLNALGAGCELTSNTQVTITYNEKNYVLSLNEKSLCESGSTQNLIPQYGTENYKCESIEGDIIVDDITLYELMSALDTPISLSLDYDTLTVTITKK